jgi:hypothetical protein
MKYLSAFALLAAAPAFGQTYTTCQSMGMGTFTCDSTTSHMNTTYVNPNIGASMAQGIANAQAMQEAPLRKQLLEQQIEQQRLQNELMRQQLEAQRQALANQEWEREQRETVVRQQAEAARRQEEAVRQRALARQVEAAPDAATRARLRCQAIAGQSHLCDELTPQDVAISEAAAAARGQRYPYLER